MGLGSGLNVWLTCAASSEKGLYIDYHSVELYPLDYSVIEAYSKELKIEKDDIFWRIHKAEWDGDLKSISSNFGLAKYQVSLLEFEFPAEIDLVFYDAFAPSVQPELWTAEVFQKIFNSMNNGAILVTYCCKGDVRRAMISVGFEVERIAGPPGKREMIRATKPLTE
jgi:tRNA U34 5-methylaminomethyl-2-thiouridine-forming methyltransferase MnmC